MLMILADTRRRYGELESAMRRAEGQHGPGAGPVQGVRLLGALVDSGGESELGSLVDASGLPRLAV